MRKLFYLIALIGITILCALLNSCSAPYYLAKFKNKGGKIECDVDTLKVVDTLIIDGKPVIVIRDSIVVRSQIEYVTKWEIKYKYLTAKQEQKTERKQIKEDNKTERLESNNDRKATINQSNNERKVENNFGRWIIFVIIAFISGVLTTILLPRLIRLLKKSTTPHL